MIHQRVCSWEKNAEKKLTPIVPVEPCAVHWLMVRFVYARWRIERFPSVSRNAGLYRTALRPMIISVTILRPMRISLSTIYHTMTI